MKAREILLATAVYALLTVAMTWPVATRLGDAVPWYNDAWIFVWDVAHVRTAILDPARGLFETREVFWPDGISLAFHTMAPLYGVLAIPLVPLVGLIATYNAFFLLCFVSAALGAHALARSLGASTLASYLAGIAFSFAPFHQMHGPHLNLLSVQFLPLIAWAALRFLATANRRHALWLTLGGVLSLYACHEYALFAALMVVTLAAAMIAGRARLAPLADLAGRGALAAALALLLGLPILLPMLAEGAVETHYAERVDLDFAADLLAWITPSVRHSLWGGYTMKIYQYFPGVMAEWTTYLGVVVALLALVAGFGHGRAAWPWLLLAAVFAGFALGPNLRILGSATSLVLPYRALELVPIVSAMREPSRFAAVVTLAVAILAALGLDVVRRGAAARFAWLALPLTLLDFAQVPVPMSDARVPSFLREIARDDQRYAVLEVPSGLEIREHLYHQAVHRKPIFLGYVARMPAASWRFIETLPLLSDPATWRLDSDQRRRYYADLARNLNVRYALVYEAFYVRRGEPESFAAAVHNLRLLPGARVVAEEPGFVALRLDGQ